MSLFRNKRLMIDEIPQWNALKFSYFWNKQKNLVFQKKEKDRH